MGDMTPERARALLERFADCGETLPMLTQREASAAAPDLARAYLAAEERAQRAEGARDFAREWWACRWERLRDLLRGSEYESRACQIVANGTVHRDASGAHVCEPPTYAQQMNLLRWRKDAAEERAQRAEAEAAEWRRVAGAEVRAQVEADAALASRLAEVEAEAARLRETLQWARGHLVEARERVGAEGTDWAFGAAMDALAALDGEGRT